MHALTHVRMDEIGHHVTMFRRFNIFTQRLRAALACAQRRAQRPHGDWRGKWPKSQGFLQGRRGSKGGHPPIGLTGSSGVEKLDVRARV